MRVKEFLQLLIKYIESGCGTDEIQSFGTPVQSIHLSEFKPRGWVFEAPHPDGGPYLEIEDTYDLLKSELLKNNAKEDDLILVKSQLANREVEVNYIIHDIGYLNLTNSHVTK